jgi:hypothetical protein
MELQEHDDISLPFLTKVGVLSPALPLAVLDNVAHLGVAPVVFGYIGLGLLTWKSEAIAAMLARNESLLLALADHPDALRWFDNRTRGLFSEGLERLRRRKPRLFQRKPVPHEDSMSRDEYQAYLRTPHWQETRKCILERDGYQCRDCGASQVQLDVHHLTYERLGHEEDEDLVTLCHACHEARHGIVAEPKDEPMEELQPRVARLDFHAEDELIAPRKVPTGTFLFSQVLQQFTPLLSRIYLGTLEDGRMVFCTAEDLCHVALAGATRGGKSSIMRMLMAQLCYAGARVLLLNPHYSRYLIDKKEDWTPFDPYLMHDPMECRKYEVIEHFLRQVATELLPKRLEKFAHSQPVGRPYFLVLDELPAIVDHIPDAPQYLKAILREGAKVGLFLITAAQDFLVSTIFPGGAGGAVRDCYRTVEYVGGDGTTAKVLLDMPAKDVPETRLGKGTIMLRCDSVRPAQLARVPLVDNESLYHLLGPSTYIPGRQEPAEDDLVSSLMTSKSERETDPALPSRYVSGPRTLRAPQDRRQAREQRLRGQVPSVRASEQASDEHPTLPAELRRAYAAYENQMSYRDLGAKLGVSKDTAGKWVARLRDLGYIGEKADRQRV